MSSSLKLSHLFENSIRSVVVLEAMVCAGRSQQTDGTSDVAVVLVLVGADGGEKEGGKGGGRAH